MDPANLIDAQSAAIVVGGTLIATALRSGRRDMALTLRALCGLGRSSFDADAVRAELAAQVQDIRTDGLLRAAPHAFHDAEFDEATGALIAQRSIDALLAAHEAHKARRQRAAHAAARTLAQAAELAPVFGLAGTLVSLSQLPANGLATGAFTGVISMAVLTTLYGLLLANIVLAPLARMVDRAAAAEEAQRQDVVDWLAAQVAPALSPRREPLRNGTREAA